MELLRFDETSSEYLDFALGNSLPYGSPIYLDDPYCTTPSYPTGYNFVLVPSGGDANLACEQAFGPGYASNRAYDWESNIYDCTED